MLTPEQKDKVAVVLGHPAFKFSDSVGNAFYTEEKLETLYEALEILLNKVDTCHLDMAIPDRIQQILCEGTEEFPCNFDRIYTSDLDDEAKVFPDGRLQGRTAFGLLCTEQGANCIGFCEASCLLLNLKGYEAAPIISKLLKSNQSACHYVTAVVDDDGLTAIVDPERLRSCREPQKCWNLLAYQSSIMYALPTEDFCVEKIGPKGLGPDFLELAGRPGHNVYRPLDYIVSNYSEMVSESGRLDLSEANMTAEKKANLRVSLSNTVSHIAAMSFAQYHAVETKVI